MPEQLYTVKEVAEILKCNANYVYSLMNNGLLNYIVIGRRKVRKSTLENFIAQYEGFDITDPTNIKEISY